MSSLPSHGTQHGSSAKFSGSGGAVIGVCLDQTKEVSNDCVAYMDVRCHVIGTL